MSDPRDLQTMVNVADAIFREGIYIRNLVIGQSVQIFAGARGLLMVLHTHEYGRPSVDTARLEDVPALIRQLQIEAEAEKTANDAKIAKRLAAADPLGDGPQ